MAKKKRSPRSSQDDLPFDGMLTQIIADAEAGAADELEAGDGLDGECWVSTLLGLLESSTSVEELPAVAAMFRNGLAERLAARPAPETAALLHLFEEVAPRPVDALAAASPRNDIGSVPPWGDPGPVATPTVAYLMTDPFGDQEGLTLVYAATAQQRAHIVGVLVDHNHGGALRDVFVSDDVEGCLEELRGLEDEYCAVTAIEAADALTRLGRALEISRFQRGGAQTSGADVVALAALLRRRAGGVDVRPLPRPDDELDAAVEAVLAAAGLVPASPSWDAGAELLRSWGRHSGVPLRPSPVALALALFDGVATRRWSEGELAALGLALGRIVEHGFRLAADLDDDVVEELADTLEEFWPQARELLGRGKRLAPTRRAVHAELANASEDEEGWDEEGWDEEGWDDDWEDDDGAIEELSQGIPIVDLGERRPPG